LESSFSENILLPKQYKKLLSMQTLTIKKAAYEMLVKLSQGSMLNLSESFIINSCPQRPLPEYIKRDVVEKWPVFGDCFML